MNHLPCTAPPSVPDREYGVPSSREAAPVARQNCLAEPSLPPGFPDALRAVLRLLINGCGTDPFSVPQRCSCAVLVRLGGRWLSDRGFKLRNPLREGGVGLGELADDHVAAMDFLGPQPQLLLQDSDSLILGLKQRFTVYLSFTSTLCPTIVHPYDHPAIVPIRPQCAPGSSFSYSFCGGTKQLRGGRQVHPLSGHTSSFRPVKRPPCVTCRIYGLE